MRIKHNEAKRFKKTSSSGIRTLTDGVTGAHSNSCNNYFYLSLCLSQTPELAYDCFRTEMSATSNLNDNTNGL